MTAVTFAEFEGRYDIVKLLTEAGARQNFGGFLAWDDEDGQFQTLEGKPV